jgi:hypothetical protein
MKVCPFILHFNSLTGREVHATFILCLPHFHASLGFASRQEAVRKPKRYHILFFSSINFLLPLGLVWRMEGFDLVLMPACLPTI